MQNTFRKHKLLTPVKPAIGLNKNCDTRSGECVQWFWRRVKWATTPESNIWQYPAAEELVILTICNVETHHLFSSFCSRAQRSWGFNSLIRNNQHAHKLCILAANGLSICYICQKLSIVEQEKGKEKRRQRKDIIKSEIRAYLERINSRTERNSTGFEGGAISPDPHIVNKLGSTPFYPITHVEMGKNTDHSKCEWSRLPPPPIQLFSLGTVGSQARTAPPLCFPALPKPSGLGHTAR